MAESDNLESDSSPTYPRAQGFRKSNSASRQDDTPLKPKQDNTYIIRHEALNIKPSSSGYGFNPTRHRKVSQSRSYSMPENKKVNGLSGSLHDFMDQGSDIPSPSNSFEAKSDFKFNRNDRKSNLTPSREGSSQLGLELLSISEPVSECESLRISDPTPYKDNDLASDTDEMHTQNSESDGELSTIEVESLADECMQKTEVKNGRTMSRSAVPIYSSKSNSMFHRPALPRDEISQCSCILEALKRHPDSDPFLQPVDIEGLDIPDYPKIVKMPMDLSTVEEKLNHGAYEVVDDFYADVQRIFDNCYLFNRKNAPVSQMAKALQTLFEELKSIFSRLAHIIDHPSLKPNPKQAVRKPLPSDASVSNLSMANHHREFCLDALEELHSKRHKAYSRPFLIPVDWEEIGLSDYPNIIKNPMDLLTVKRKLVSNKYANALDFAKDIRLIFHNCFKYNTPSGQVYQMGSKLQEAFEAKWAQFPGEERHQKAPRQIDSTSELRVQKRKHTKSQSAMNPSAKLATGMSRNSQVFTHAQKRQLEEAINRLSGAKLNKVVDIICRYMPELGSKEEIELDMDLLDNKTLSKIYSLVMSDNS